MNFSNLGRRLILLLGRLLLLPVVKVSVTGRENLPEKGPLIIVANHFSLLDPPLLALHLPYQPVFMAAADLQDFLLVRLLIRLFKAIPIWRGRADRTAIRRAQETLKEGGILVLLPEGGIDPDLQELASRGENVQHIGGQSFRHSGQLIPARPGAAYLAAQTGAPLLPVAIIGAEKLPANLRRLRRTPVELRIGPSFGPLEMESHLRGAARRQQLNRLGEQLMKRLAALMPAENRGPFAV